MHPAAVTALRGGRPAGAQRSLPEPLHSRVPAPRGRPLLLLLLPVWRCDSGARSLEKVARPHVQRLPA